MEDARSAPWCCVRTSIKTVRASEASERAPPISSRESEYWAARISVTSVSSSTQPTTVPAAERVGRALPRNVLSSYQYSNEMSSRWSARHVAA